MIRASNPDEDAYNAITQKLRRYRSMVANYQACKELYDNMFPSGVTTLTDMSRGGSQTTEGDRYADRRWSMSERMAASLEDMRTAYEELEALISTATGDYHTVLLRRYMLNESYEIISEKMHCHRNTVKNWHDRAIRTILKNIVL